MGLFGNLIRRGLLSAAALAVLRPARPTPRKPERRKAAPTADPKRAAARAAAKARFDKQIRKEREIGVDPIFWHGNSFRKDQARPGWLKRNHEWDRAHG